MTDRQVKTAYGTVEGISGRFPGNTVFLGIPFALPPVGKLRYMPPKEPKGWKGVLRCDCFSKACIQERRSGESADTSEDCLTLNLYTSAQTGQEKLPVLLWIYGGAFRGGSASEPEYNGEALAAKGAVVVTINYRCSALGFFSTKELEERTGFAGNLGIMDQIAALKWVQRNIATFGGDPHRVTIFGQSAGGISVRMLLVSPMAKGLFHRAIVESGGGLNEADPVRSKEEFQDLCRECMNTLGWNVDELLSRDAHEVNRALEDAARVQLEGRELALFQPFVDNVILPDVPGKCIDRGEFVDVPVICGTVAGDSWMFSRKVRKQISDSACFRGFSFAPGQSWGRRQLELGKMPIYTYYMDRKQPPRELYFRRGTPPYGASTPHCSEIAYIFGTLSVRNLPYTELDYQISEYMQSYWLNFAVSGNPNGGGLPEWPQFTEESRLTLRIGDEGISAENVVQNAAEERVITYTMEHPGMLESLEGF